MRSPQPDELSAAQFANAWRLVHRNSQRLLKPVNTLLEFSRIEAGRCRRHLSPWSLAAFTAELASVFRAAAERAGVRLVVDCPPLAEPIHVDREMWEKIVLNLLSNAFKFTFEGEIEVKLQPVGSGASADRAGHRRRHSAPSDGESLRNRFDQRSKIPCAAGRRAPGSASQGPGAVKKKTPNCTAASSRVGESHRGGHCYYDLRHLYARLRIICPDAGPTIVRRSHHGATTAAHRALRRRSDGLAASPAPGAAASAGNLLDPQNGVPRRRPSGRTAPRCCSRTTTPTCEVIWRDCSRNITKSKPFRDGMAALQAARHRSPDLILSDVMMPKLDGFGLIREIRSRSRH